MKRVARFTQFPKSLQSSNSCYYRSRPKRLHRAVASHSPNEPSNPAGFSRYIPDESTMHHSDRKSVRLPCNYTVAQSWAALRKAWNAFKIAHSNGNLDLMRKYAKVIRKLQLQMGIQLLPFDEDILDEQTDYELFIQNFDLECQWREENQVTEEKAPDYDHMMDKIDLPPNIPEPSDTIFVRRLEKSFSPVENSAPKLIVQKSTTYNEKSCPVGPQSMHVRTNVRVTKQTINYQSSCPIESSQDSPAEDELFEESEPGYEKQSPSDPEDSNDIFSNWGQSHIVHEDNSCLYEPAEQDRQHMNNERDLERKRKSNFYKTDS